jgi:endonuclease/exonuclease/phosphatase family metal-dependent hydrolase
VSPSALRGQDVTSVGDSTTLDIATWNIEWFGDANNGPSNDALQLDNVAAVMVGSGIDLWGVQEIADATDFEALLERLGEDFEGHLATNSGQQRIGFVYNKNTVQLRQIQHILEDFEYEFASRPPLRLEADVTLPDTTVSVTFVVLHMKAFSDSQSYERRAEASLRLKNHIEFTSLDTQPVIVLGDWNDQLTESTYASQISPYQNFIDDPDDYYFVSLPLEQAGAGTYCTNSTCSSTGSMLDHLLISNELYGAYLPESAGFIPNLTTDVPVYGSTTSDHLPLFARFDFTRVSGTANAPGPLPFTFQVEPLFPNPTASRVEIALTLHRPADVSIALFDAIGRQVLIQSNPRRPGGRMKASLDVSALPAGSYFVRISSGGEVVTLPLFKTHH